MQFWLKCRALPDKLLEWLAGAWSLERKISSGEQFSGSAIFEPCSETSLKLEESGTLFLQGGDSITANRNWVWHFEGENLSVFFDEDPLRLYHNVPLSRDAETLAGMADHVCGKDVYAGEYRFSDDHFTIDQRVNGPAKNYTIASRYERK